MVRQFRSLAPEDPLSVVVAAMLDGFQQDFSVVEGGRLVGMLDRTELVTALREHGDHVTVAAVVRPECPPVHPNGPVEAAMRVLAEAGRQSLPVVRDGKLVGMLTADNLGEFLTVRDALREWKSGHGGGRP